MKRTADLRINGISRICKHSIFYFPFFIAKHGLLKKFYGIGFCMLLLLCSCNAPHKTVAANTNFLKSSYGYDAAFLKQHSGNVLELSSANNQSKILLSAAYQGRVMTSTAGGDTGRSFGWLNYDLLAATEKKKQFNPVGGEERFWLGPEGGQYALYFKGGDSFNIAHWQVPAVIDTVAYTIVRADRSEAVFSKKATLTNYSGATFTINIERTVTLLDKATVENKLKISIPAGVRFVGYQSENRLQNAGTADWKKESGLLSIWLLGMFSPTPKTVVVIPFLPIENARRYITDSYFGNVPPQRLQVQDSVLYFTCDGTYRSKIGLSPAIAKPLAASFDFENNVLTLLLPQLKKDAPYVNSKWEWQREPYNGDVINSYNDGPLADGTQMGPFYEIESSSPALELKRGEAATYTQTTVHLQGDYALMRQLAKGLLGVELDAIKR